MLAKYRWLLIVENNLDGPNLQTIKVSNHHHTTNGAISRQTVESLCNIPTWSIFIRVLAGGRIESNIKTKANKHLDVEL